MDGRPVTLTDPEGNAVRKVYDSDGRLLKTVDAAGHEIEYRYDDTGAGGCASCSGQSQDRPVEILYPTYNKKIRYDTRGWKIGEIDQLGETEALETLYEYDGAGNLITLTDREGKATQRFYDPLNRLEAEADPAGSTTNFSYDDRNNLIALTDAAGNTTRFEYDRNNKKVKEIRPLGQVTTFAYDGEGRLRTKTDPKGQRAEYQYDAAGRLIQTEFFDADAAAVPAKTVTYAYNAAGKLLSYDDGTTTGTYAYDAAGRKVSETVDYGAFTRSYSYAYNPDGTKAGLTGPDGATLGYYYDAANRITGVEMANLGIIAFPSYDWNRPTRVTLPGGGSREFDYDALMRTTRISSLNGDGGLMLDYHYTYDKTDHVTARETEHGDYRYEYDDSYQLIKAERPDSTEAEEFDYDPVGNRTYTREAGGSFVHDQNNALVSAGNIAYEYDENGNMVRRLNGETETAFTYSPENRLSRVEDAEGNLVALYYYDPFGRRLWKEVDGERTYFFYSDEGLIAEYDANGNETKAYAWKPGATWSTDPLLMKTNGQFYLYHNDHLGTPQMITATTGEVVWQARYKVFGSAEVLSSSTVTNNLRFAGQYFDDETGLHYNFHRYYDPETGRYLRVDPIGFEGGINLYAYVQNNPINYFDPFGLYTFREGLQDTSTYAWVFGTGSAFVPGGQVAALTFAGIAVTATALEIGLYSEDPFWEGMRESVKMLIPIKNPFVDRVKDEAIDKAYDIFKQQKTDKTKSECP